MTAEIAARQQLLAALEAEFQAWKGSTNAAIVRLNAATAGGDTALFGVANAAIVVVGALNPYHQVLLKAAADAKAEVPDVPPPPPPPPVLSFPATGFAVVEGQTIDITQYSTIAGGWSMVPSAHARLSVDGKLTGVQAGTATLDIEVDDGQP